MSRQKRTFGVPLHPLLVHFPVAFWLVALLLDAGAILAGPEPWRALAFGSVIAGLVTGVAAIATGLLEYMQPSLAGIDMRLAARHGVRTTSAWCIFAARTAVAALLPAQLGTMILCFVLDLAGCALLMQGIYLGTRQVYDRLEKS